MEEITSTCSPGDLVTSYARGYKRQNTDLFDNGNRAYIGYSFLDTCGFEGQYQAYEIKYSEKYRNTPERIATNQKNKKMRLKFLCSRK